jgi:sugar phosphate permease
MVDSVKNSVFRFRYVLLTIIAFCYSIQYLDRVNTNILLPFISKDIGMSNYEIGIGAALMLIFYGPSQVVTGWICDKIGSRKVLIFSIIAWSTLTYLQSAVHSVSEWYLRMVLFGIMVGTEFIPSARLIVRYFPPLQRARAQSILSWSWIITPAWAPMVSTLLFTLYGNEWREIFKLLGLIGAIPLILVVLFVFDRPEQNRFVKQAEALEAYEDEIKQGIITEEDVKSRNVQLIAHKSQGLNVPFTQILKTPGYIPLVFVYVAAQLAFWGVMVWSAQYLIQVHGFSVMKMGVWASIYFIGGALGSFASGWVSDKILGGRRKPMIILCFACMIPFIVILATLTKGVSPFVLLLTLTGAGFFSNMVWGPAITLPADMFPVESYGKAMGGVNCIAYMAAAASPYIMGGLIQIDPVTKSANYFYAWLWVAFTALLGVLAASRLVDKKRAKTALHERAVSSC